jgi:hypothetical protein
MADFAIKIRDEALATYRAEVAAALKEARQDNALMFPDVKGWKPITAFDHGVHQAFYTIRRYLGLNTVRKHLGQGEKESEWWKVMNLFVADVEKGFGDSGLIGSTSQIGPICAETHFPP